MILADVFGACLNMPGFFLNGPERWHTVQSGQERNNQSIKQTNALNVPCALPNHSLYTRSDPDSI